MAIGLFNTSNHPQPERDERGQGVGQDPCQDVENSPGVHFTFKTRPLPIQSHIAFFIKSLIVITSFNLLKQASVMAFP